MNYLLSLFDKASLLLPVAHQPEMVESIETQSKTDDASEADDNAATDDASDDNAGEAIDDADDDDDDESVPREPSFEEKCAKILEATGLLAEEVNFEFAPKGTDMWKGQMAAISFGIFQPPPKYSDEQLIVNAITSFFQQHLLLEGDLKDYCALIATLLLVIFPSSDPNVMEMSVRLLAHLAKDERFLLYVRFVRGSVFDPTVKSRMKEISHFWNQILGTGCFELSARGFNYNNMHRTAEQIADMSVDNDIPDLFLGFFLQWLPHRLKGLEFSAHRWHKNAERSFGYAATLLHSAMP